MAKKITITLCAIIIGISTIFITQNTVKADTQQNQPVDITYSKAIIDGYTDKGINFTYNEENKAVKAKGTLINNGSQRYYFSFTKKHQFIEGKTYSAYVYTTCKDPDIQIYSNQAGIGFKYFINKFFKFKGKAETMDFNMSFPAIYTEDYFNGYYKFMCWEGDWELNKDIVNSLNYQIGYSEGKINGYEEGYNKGSTDGYTKGQQNAIETINNAYYLNRYFFNSNSEAIGKVYETKYGTTNDRLLGNFNLGVSTDNGLTFVNAKEYYTNYTPQSYNYIEVYTTNEDFTYGYNQLQFNGLPIGTLIHLKLKFIAKNEYTDISYAVNSNGELHYLHGGQQGYVPNTCLYSIRINGFIGYNFETGKENTPLQDATFFNLKDYANFSITLPEDYINKSLYENGYNNAKNEYYNKWYIGRYQQGYNEGTKNAGNYTFLSLMGAVVDAPVKTISDMLNFEILGFNMKQFFYAIITVCIIVTIVNFLL